MQHGRNATILGSNKTILVTDRDGFMVEVPTWKLFRGIRFRPEHFEKTSDKKNLERDEVDKGRVESKE